MIGPKLHDSFKKIGSIRSIDDDEDSVNDDIETTLTLADTNGKIPTMNIF